MSLGGDNVMPPRPGYGTAPNASRFVVYANYVQLFPESSLVLYSYAVNKITPDVVGKKRTQIIRLMLNETPEFEKYRNDIVTDFKATLISRVKIEPAEGTITVTYKAEGEDEPKQGAIQYKIEYAYTKTLTVSDLMSYLTSTNPADGLQYDSKLEMIQALNIFLNHYAKSTNTLTTIGKSKTFSIMNAANSQNMDDLGRGLTAIRGFFTSVRAATNRILVNINVSHGAFVQEGELKNLMNTYGVNPNERSMRSLEKFLRRVRVRVTHLREKKNKKGEIIYRFKSIAALAKKTDGRRSPHPPKVSQFGAGPKNVEFWLLDNPQSSSSATPASDAGPGRYISVFDHFQKNYGITMNPNLPVVNVGTEEKPSYLPAEVCVVVPGQNAIAKLSSDQTRNMIRFAVRGPWMNAESIIKDGLGIAGLSEETNELLAKFGLKIGHGLITVPARLLPEPKVFYKDGKPGAKPSSKVVNVFNGSWNMENIQFNKPGELKTWSWISLIDGQSRYPPRYTMDNLRITVDKFTASLKKNGVSVRAQPLPGKEVHMRFPSDPNLEQIFHQATSKAVDLLLVILPGRDKGDNTELYNWVKTLGDVKHGVHTICVVGQKFTAAQDQFFANVALKFNLKLGGNNQSVDPSRLSFINEDKTMLVGIDVTHPSPGSRSNAPSVAGMVASTDKHLGQWPGILSIQNKARAEMVSDLTEMLKQHLKNWLDLGHHSRYPENILVYRDGVSEGQYQRVLDEEVPLLRAACRETYPANGPQPSITVIIVGKRHHTRFYPTQTKDMDRGGNCKAGTVVDRGITEESFWDFYLQSHAVIQGTGRPAHYVVILDEIFRARAQRLGTTQQDPSAVANELERMTQALCYSYSRATKAVSICTPAYHADILCERARRYMADLFEGGSDEASTVAGSSSGKVDDTKSTVTIHEKLKNTMFYI
ncbi:Piwi-domain-containing protein [Cryphonectria parasitica EP155]|uniref:Piwi-domain-containing protein n=1 Tax=Cryphonectria parasitica (strain ATCC 38755 / EP155) TaxID=660469 RepID=A0A9P4XY89_CRYP1|nr:Piwi-domain-containing protein [Cryphonectria parasitica EP155]KAF3763126.1 Piwi-domain-containing protein [Cryphonectria parasitica EP155]